MLLVVWQAGREREPNQSEQLPPHGPQPQTPLHIQVQLNYINMAVFFWYQKVTSPVYLSLHAYDGQVIFFIFTEYQKHKAMYQGCILSK